MVKLLYGAHALNHEVGATVIIHLAPEQTLAIAERFGISPVDLYRSLPNILTQLLEREATS
jgi:hypothetical protein